jgi:hypothetical protein
MRQRGLTGDSHTLLNLPADIAVDPTTGRHIADGCGGHRIVVFVAAGTRHWGGVGGGPGGSASDGGHPLRGHGQAGAHRCVRSGQRPVQVFDKFIDLQRIISSPWYQCSRDGRISVGR